MTFAAEEFYEQNNLNTRIFSLNASNRQKKQSFNNAVTFIEQNGYKIATEIVTPLAVSYISANNTLHHCISLNLTTLGFKTIRAIAQEKYNSLSSMTQGRLMTTPLGAMFFDVHATFIISSLITMFYNNNVNSLRFFLLTFSISKLTCGSNPTEPELSGVLSDMILLNSIYGFIQDHYTYYNGYSA